MLFSVYYAKLLLTNYHHKTLNEPDKKYSFLHDKLAIYITIIYIIIVLVLTVYPFYYQSSNLYGFSFGEAGFCYS